MYQMRFSRVTRKSRLPLASQRILHWTLGIVGAVVAGTLGYCLIEGWSIADGFYMTMITFSTVGYAETHELSVAGRLYTSGLIFLSIILMACWTAGITTTYVSGELSGRHRQSRTKKMIQKLSGHTIVVGSGIMAQAVIDLLDRAERPWVLIDDDPAGLEKIRQQFPQGLVIDCCPRNELALADANIFAAASVVAVLNIDFDNLLVAMSVKELNPKIRVHARSDDPRIASRMLKFGVDQVVCPFQLSGSHIAESLISRKEHTALA